MSAAAEQQIYKDLRTQGPYRDLVNHNGPAEWAQSTNRHGGLRKGRHALGVSTGNECKFLSRRHWSIRDAQERADFGAGVARRVKERLQRCGEEPLHQVFKEANSHKWAATQARVQRQIRAEALDPGTSPARLAELADHSSEAIRRAVARNRSAPATTLERLAGDIDEGVRREVATNPASPIEALRALARRPDTPAEILARLASDRRANIRRWAAKNAATPAAAVETLASDPRPSVRAAALVALARTGWGAAALVVGGKPDGAWTPPVETRRHLRVVESDREGELRHVVTD